MKSYHNNNYFKYLLNFLLLYIPASMLCSCGPTYTLREDVIQHYADSCQEFSNKMERDDVFYYRCFNYDKLATNMKIKEVCSNCSNECGKNMVWGIQLSAIKMPSGPGYYANKEEEQEYVKKVNHCIVSEYINKNVENFSIEKMLDEQCRFALLLYVVSNNKDSENAQIFEKYLESRIQHIQSTSPERFYCFSRSKEELFQIIKEFELIAIKELNNFYNGSLPRMADKDFVKRYDQAFSGSARYYLERNKKYYTTKDLNNSQQKVCKERIEPYIHEYFPNFDLSAP